jgi:hypothetical protein
MNLLFFFSILALIQASFYSEGNIGDAKCSVESVEFANTAAIKEILSGSMIDLIYFNNFRIVELHLYAIVSSQYEKRV